MPHKPDTNIDRVIDAIDTHRITSWRDLGECLGISRTSAVGWVREARAAGYEIATGGLSSWRVLRRPSAREAYAHEAAMSAPRRQKRQPVQR